MAQLDQTRWALVYDLRGKKGHVIETGKRVEVMARDKINACEKALDLLIQEHPELERADCVWAQKL